MELTFSRTLKRNKRVKITEDCLDNSLLRVNKKIANPEYEGTKAKNS